MFYVSGEGLWLSLPIVGSNFTSRPVNHYLHLSAIDQSQLIGGLPLQSKHSLSHDAGR